MRLHILGGEYGREFGKTDQMKEIIQSGFLNVVYRSEGGVSQCPLMAVEKNVSEVFQRQLDMMSFADVTSVPEWYQGRPSGEYF